MNSGRVSNWFKSCVGAGVAALLLAGCASTDVVGTTEFVDDTRPPAVMFNEALALMDNAEYVEAAAAFDELEQVHPYSEYAKRALVLGAFSNFSSGRYPEAVNAGRRYTTLHPSGEDAAYAQFIVAQSYYNQIPDVTRDQEQTQRAIGAFRDLIRLYPDSEYVQPAQEQLRFAFDQLAGAEMRVGRYYLDRRNYIASINRFRVVVEEYQTTRHIEEALHRLVENYLTMGVVDEAQTAAAVLGHNFPESEWYGRSFALLQSGGLEPQENAGSWISRAFDDFTGNIL
ncbi:MAG: outer membrane protein assembly factor BamD [Devosiaceae bacterium]|nr:outer membrane protein assembly factor BamD [Devosiaceae bacterium MH13]